MSAPFTVQQEPDALAKRKLMTITVASCVIFGGAVAVSGWLLEDLRRGRDTGPAAAAVAPTTIGILEQGLILGPPRGLEAHRAQRESLARWGWVDRDAGVARIPIDRAMDLVAAGVVTDAVGTDAGGTDAGVAAEAGAGRETRP